MKVLFVIFILSAAAMDSENFILPGMACLISLCMLYAGCGMGMSKKKEPVAADSIKKTFYNCIIAQGKERVNGKMQDMQGKLRQWGTGRGSMPRMSGRRKAKTDKN